MSRTLKTVLDEANPNKEPSAFQIAKAGSALGVVGAFVTGTVTSNKLTLPTGQKALQVLSAFSRVGTLTGYLTPIATETTPTTGQVAVNANGDIVFAVADAVTSAEVVYQPVEGEIYTDSVAVVASSATLLQSRRALKILSVSVVTGVIPGAKTVVARGTAAPTAGNVALNAAGAAVVFNAADVVAGTALITYIATPGVGNGPALPLSGRLLSDVSM